MNDFWQNNENIYQAKPLPERSLEDLLKLSRYNVPLDFTKENLNLSLEKAQESGEKDLNLLYKAAKKAAELNAMYNPLNMLNNINAEAIKSNNNSTTALIQGILQDSYVPRNWG